MSDWFRGISQVVHTAFGSWFICIVFFLILIAIDGYVNWFLKRTINWSADDFENEYGELKKRQWTYEILWKYFKHKMLLALRALVDVLIASIVLVTIFSDTGAAHFIKIVFELVPKLIHEISK